MPDIALSPITPVTNGAIVSATNPLPVTLAGGTEINVRMFGAMGNDSADDYPAIQRAVDYGKTLLGGATIVIPPGIYQLQTGEVVLDQDNLHIVIQPGATVKQMTYGWSTFQIRSADGCSVTGGGKILNSITKTQITGPAYDGWPARNRAVGVYCIEHNDTLVADLTFENMVVDIQFHPTDSTTTINTNNSVRNILSHSHDFGFVSAAQRNLTIHNLQGYVTDNSQPTAPPHLIYLTFDQVSTLYSENVVISDVVDYDNAFSSSIKARYCTEISMVNCLSRLCARGFDINCDYLTMISPQVHELVDIGDSQQGGIVLEDVHFSDIINPIIVLPDNNDVLEAISARTNCSDITITGGRISSSRTGGASNAPSRVFGERIVFIDVHFEERTTNKFPIQFQDTAVDCKLIRPRITMTGGTRIAAILAGATDTVIEIAPTLLNFEFGTTTSISDLGTDTLVSFSGRLPISTLANLPAAAVYARTSIFASDAAGNKNPVTSDSTVWRYPDGTAV